MSVLLTLLLVVSAVAAEGDAPYAVVLGIAQDAGAPQAGCTKACCASAWQDPPEPVASLGLVAGNQHWILDATPDFPAQEHSLPGELGGILLTHAHIGHYTGLMYLGREAMGVRGVQVWAMPRMRAFLEANGPWSQLVKLGNIELRPLEDGVNLGDLHVRAVQVPHRDEFSETVGLVVTGPNRRLLYLPDIDKWSTWDRPIEEVLSEVDVALLDGTFYDGEELPGRDMSEIPHPFIIESIRRFAPLPKRLRSRVVFTHLNHTNPALRPGEARAAIEAAGHGVATHGDRHPL